eukprot:GHVH01014521.1.p1 GENE.GHVH01014521.1~~GHVH01014521.1.p1  ORF type:complete len:1094 (+),score=164.67 GHVH01014521.1:80-3361(+)
MVQLDLSEQDELRQMMLERSLAQVVQSAGVAALNDLDAAVELSKGVTLPKEQSAIEESERITKLSQPLQIRMGTQFKTNDDSTNTNSVITSDSLQQYLFEFGRTYREIFLQASVLSRLDFVEGPLRSGTAAMSAIMHVREQVRLTANFLWEAQTPPNGTAQIGLSRYCLEAAQEVIAIGEFTRLPKLLELAVVQAGEIDPQSVLARREISILSPSTLRRLSTAWKTRWIHAPVRHDRSKLEILQDEGKVEIKMMDQLNISIVDDLSGRFILLGCSHRLVPECGAFLQPSLLKGLLNTLTTSNAIYEQAHNLIILILDSKLRVAYRERRVVLDRLRVINGNNESMVKGLRFADKEGLDLQLEARLMKAYLKRTRTVLSEITVQKHNIQMHQASRQYANLFWTARRIMSRIIFSVIRDQAVPVAGMCGYPGGVWTAELYSLHSPFNMNHFKEILERLLSITRREVDSLKPKPTDPFESTPDASPTPQASSPHSSDDVELRREMYISMKGLHSVLFDESDVPGSIIAGIPPLFSPEIRDFFLYPYFKEDDAGEYKEGSSVDKNDGDVIMEDPEVDVHDTIEPVHSPPLEERHQIKSDMFLSLIAMNCIHKLQHLKAQRLPIGFLPLWSARQGALLPPPLPLLSHPEYFFLASGGCSLSPGVYNKVDNDESHLCPPTGIVADLCLSEISGDIFLRLEPISGWLAGLRLGSWSPHSNPILWNVLLTLFKSDQYHLLCGHVVVSGASPLQLHEMCLLRSFQCDLSRLSSLTHEIASIITITTNTSVFQIAKDKSRIEENNINLFMKHPGGSPHTIHDGDSLTVWPGLETDMVATVNRQKREKQIRKQEESSTNNDIGGDATTGISLGTNSLLSKVKSIETNDDEGLRNKNKNSSKDDLGRDLIEFVQGLLACCDRRICGSTQKLHAVTSSLSVSSKCIHHESASPMEFSSQCSDPNFDAYQWLTSAADSPLKTHRMHYEQARDCWSRPCPRAPMVSAKLTCSVPAEIMFGRKLLTSSAGTSLFFIELKLSETLDLFTGSAELKIEYHHNLTAFQSFIETDYFTKLMDEFSESCLPPLMVRSWVAAVRLSPVEAFYTPVS